MRNNLEGLVCPRGSSGFKDNPMFKNIKVSGCIHVMTGRELRRERERITKHLKMSSQTNDTNCKNPKNYLGFQ